MTANREAAQRWLEHGASLIASAQFLFDTLTSNRCLPSERGRVLELGQLRGAMTLLGAGLECVLKARAISDGIITAVPGKGMGKIDRLWSSHDLRGMAVALSLPLDNEELLLLDRASHGVRWIGRYPDPKTRAEFEKAISIDAQKLRSPDFASAGHVQLLVQQSLPG